MEAPHRRAFFGLVIGAVLSAAVLAYVSWVIMGLGPCGGDGTPRISPSSPAAEVCRTEFPRWNASLHPSPTTVDTIRGSLGFILPVALVLLGFGASALLRQRTPFFIGLGIAVVLIIAPWLALAVLPDS